VKRGLFLSFFIRMAIALAFVVAMRIWFNPRGLVLDVVLLIGWAALNAYFLARSVRQNITRLEASTAAIPERHVGVVDPS
jgi:two-component system phosphate regulon sensor histidine kinase PhoR